MRSKSVLGVVLAFGVAFTLMSGSGIGPELFGQDPGGAESASTLEDLGEEADLEDNDPSSGGGGIIATVTGADNIIGLILATASTVVEFAGAVALLPITLTRLGFPHYFAVPIGAVAQIIAFTGFAQFITGREYL